MLAVALQSHLKSVYPGMSVSIHVYDCDGKDLEVVEFEYEGDVYADPIELAHRGIENDFGFPGLTEADAQLISDHNKEYNAWACAAPPGGLPDGSSLHLL